MKFRKRLFVVEAFQLTSDCADRLSWPKWMRSHPALATQLDWSQAGNSTHIKDSIPWVSIETPEGTMRADVSDWIILGVRGEVYPCKPDIFALTYGSADA